MKVDEMQVYLLYTGLPEGTPKNNLSMNMSALCYEERKGSCEICSTAHVSSSLEKFVGIVDVESVEIRQDRL